MDVVRIAFTLIVLLVSIITKVTAQHNLYRS